MYRSWINKGDLVDHARKKTDNENSNSKKDNAFKTQQERIDELDECINARRDGEDNCAATNINLG
jgi:hypothetical protein